MIDVRQSLQLPSGASTTDYSLPALEKQGMGRVSRLPVSVRILLESVLPRPGQTATLRIESRDGRRASVPLRVRIDTPIEAAYFVPAGSCRTCSSSWRHEENDPRSADSRMQPLPHRGLVIPEETA
jgi:aconitase A